MGVELRNLDFLSLPGEGAIELAEKVDLLPRNTVRHTSFVEASMKNDVVLLVVKYDQPDNKTRDVAKFRLPWGARLHVNESWERTPFWTEFVPGGRLNNWYRGIIKHAICASFTYRRQRYSLMREYVG